MNDFDQFERILQNGSACVSIVTHEERYALEIIRETARRRACDIWVWSSGGGIRDGLLDGSAYVPDTETASAGLTSFAKAKAGSICVALDMADQVRQGKPLRLLRDMIDTFHQTSITTVLIDHTDSLPEVIKSHAQTFELSYPDAEELKSIVKATLLLIHRKKPIEIGITPKGLDAVVRNLRGLTRRQAARIIRETVAENQRFKDDDLNKIIAGKRRFIQRDGLLEYVQTPLDLAEIGGMGILKTWLNERQDTFGDEASAFGLEPPKGVLMLGVQGAGKSLCAKAIATAWRQPLLRLDPGTLYNSYIGRSEHNLREALRQTEMMSPVILWIDEIEKAFASSASHSADGGLSQRMFGTLLTWLQEHEAPVFVVATANDIGALPPELLRKGRFDEIFFVDLPTEPVRADIFAIHLKKRQRNPDDFDLNALAQASNGFSGSEIERIILSGLHTAFSDKQALDTERLIKSLQVSPPLSVTMAERISSLRAWAKGRCVSAD
ncbi:MAG: AAA family ATPase [Planctomycetes bacterium]|nr:AAA family ATPase [Planctomycetota bacterium]